MNKQKTVFVVALSKEVNTEKIGIDLSLFDGFVFTGNTEDRGTISDIKKNNKQDGLYSLKINEKYDILFTGIGKINATFALTKYLCQQINNGFIFETIYNIGTAGGAGSFVKIGDVILCDRHIQLDMNATPQKPDEIGFTPYDNTKRVINANEAIKNKVLNKIDILKNKSTNHQFTCATMDTFNTNNTEYDIYDMEAYALAKTAYRFLIPFVSIKYITDNILDNSIEKTDIFWRNNLKNANDKLTKIITDIISFSL